MEKDLKNKSERYFKYVGREEVAKFLGIIPKFVYSQEKLVRDKTVGYFASHPDTKDDWKEH